VPPKPPSMSSKKRKKIKSQIKKHVKKLTYKKKYNNPSRYLQPVKKLQKTTKEISINRVNLLIKSPISEEEFNRDWIKKKLTEGHYIYKSIED